MITKLWNCILIYVNLDDDLVSNKTMQSWMLSYNRKDENSVTNLVKWKEESKKCRENGNYILNSSLTTIIP